MWVIDIEVSGFVIHPTSVSLKSGDNFDFAVYFSPTVQASYYCHALQAFCYLKREKNEDLDELGRLQTTQTTGFRIGMVN